MTITTDPARECAGSAVCDGAEACGAFCGMEPAPPGGACPAACTGGCAGGTCTIDCGANDCAGAALVCPDGFACAVLCNGTSRCSGAVVACPESYACDVTCQGQSACRDITVNCASTGTCHLDCNADNGVCRDAALNCGVNECAATCAGSTFLPQVVCPTPGPEMCACTSC